LAGTGSISLDRVRGATGTLTANKAVGPGQTVVFGAGNDSRLTLNAPKAFAGTVNLAGAGVINLAGLPEVASESFKADILTLYNAGGHAVDSLHIQAPVGSLSVERTAIGISIYNAGDYYHAAGTLLAAHA
jgi:hypothetical protein